MPFYFIREIDRFVLRHIDFYVYIYVIYSQNFIQVGENEEQSEQEEEMVRVKESRGFLVKGRCSTSAINRGTFNKVAGSSGEEGRPNCFEVEEFLIFINSNDRSYHSQICDVLSQRCPDNATFRQPRFPGSYSCFHIWLVLQFINEKSGATAFLLTVISACEWIICAENIFFAIAFTSQE